MATDALALLGKFPRKDVGKLDYADLKSISHSSINSNRVLFLDLCIPIYAKGDVSCPWI